ncbi:hypothetical protein HYALB_00011464 [Hymenoscyphus albidus]|uniref:Mg2+ transporter protein, CorA-like/Zinc transport protein ZntB n=1 Tax=Hymenoscyphus albidus TaxID=595503 RepID=A0A9N9LUA2_9HELO|nr:hypothetical protein HYALB_00011464 [Hymenoscyphus albidus]
MLLQESYTLLDLKIQQFRDMSSLARELEASNMAKINYNKDRQEAAIFVFTIVTVIFLPLTTVAGILGMNTNDVRNMDIDQWVFWVTAIPLIILVIALCLLWTGELWNVGRWFSNAGRGGNGQESIRRQQVSRVGDSPSIEGGQNTSRLPAHGDTRYETGMDGREFESGHGGSYTWRRPRQATF